LLVLFPPFHTLLALKWLHKLISQWILVLGLGDKLEWSHPRTVCLIDGKFQQLDSPLTLLKFSPLRINERVRVAAVGALLKLTGSGLYEDQTAEPWLRRWMGKRPYSMIFEPLFIAKFGAMRDQIALPWFWARFHDRTTYLGYLRGGFQQLYDRLVERISQAGGKVLLGTRVEKAEPIDDDRWEIQTNNGTWTADRVISTMATRLTCRLISAMPGEYRARFDWG
jgi:protoporphyrinogen oxidase